MIALVKHEDLGLVGEPPKGRGMDDPVAIAPKGIAGGARRLREDPAAAGGRIGRIGGARDEGFNRHDPPAVVPD